MTINNDSFNKTQLKQFLLEVARNINDNNMPISKEEKKYATDFIEKFYKSINNASSLNINIPLEEIFALIILEQSQEILRLKEQSQEFDKIKEINQVLSKEIKNHFIPLKN